MSHSVIRNQKAKLAADYNDLLKELASPKLKSIGCYTFGETIGRGSYGKVKLGVHQLTCRLVAIKKISKKHAPLMAREIHHHRQLHHPNIVSLYEILTTETSIFIVSEHCPHGDLFDALARKGRFSEHHTKTWFLQLVDAIQYCHSLGIIHRDLKLENILLDEHDQVKICDFGFARQTDKNQLLKTFCGSLAYSAPEVIQRQNYSGPATDIWSLGVILYTLLAGELPFDDDCESVLQKKVINMDYIIPPYFSPELTDLVHKILKLDPLDRLTIQQIIHHPWLKGNIIITQQPMQQHDQRLEQYTANSLLNAGFDKSVVEKMRLNQVGMLGTLWTMLLSKSHIVTSVDGVTQTDEEQQQGWMGSFKSWFVTNNNNKPNTTTTTTSKHNMVVPQQKQIPGAVQQHKFMLKTMIAPPMTKTQTEVPAVINLHPAFIKPTVLPLTPIHPKEDDDPIINTSSTCSSTADDEYDEDDHSSIASSPATSVDEQDVDDQEDKDDNKINNTHQQDNNNNTNINMNMTAFHRVSPMPSRVDILIPRSRYNLDEQRHNNKLRNRLGNKMIVEEEEEEEE